MHRGVGLLDQTLLSQHRVIAEDGGVDHQEVLDEQTDGARDFGTEGSEVVQGSLSRPS